MMTIVLADIESGKKITEPWSREKRPVLGDLFSIGHGKNMGLWKAVAVVGDVGLTTVFCRRGNDKHGAAKSGSKKV